MIAPMKGYLMLYFGTLAFCMVTFLTGCSENSGWNTEFGGMPVQQDGRPAVPAGTAPPGSGSVDYIPQMNY
jgi:hypothetical protein